MKKKIMKSNSGVNRSNIDFECYRLRRKQIFRQRFRFRHCKSRNFTFLTGSMAISEKSVRDAEVMAIEEINASGGVLGKRLNM